MICSHLPKTKLTISVTLKIQWSVERLRSESGSSWLRMKKAGRGGSQEGGRTRQIQVKFFRVGQNSADSGNTVTVVSNIG